MTVQNTFLNRILSFSRPTLQLFIYKRNCYDISWTLRLSIIPDMYVRFVPGVWSSQAVSNEQKLWTYAVGEDMIYWPAIRMPLVSLVRTFFVVTPYIKYNFLQFINSHIARFEIRTCYKFSSSPLNYFCYSHCLKRI